MEEKRKENEEEKPTELDTKSKNDKEDKERDDEYSLKSELIEEGDEAIDAEAPKYDATKDRHYRKMGFYCALNLASNTVDKFAVLVKDFGAHSQERINNINNYFQKNRERIQSKVNQAEEKLKAEKERLDKYRIEIEDLKKGREINLTELKNLKMRIHEEYKKLAESKKNLVNNTLKERLNEISDELRKVIDNFQLLSEKKFEINKRIFNENKEVLQKKVKRFEALRNQVEEAYRIIRKRIDNLNDAGFTENIFRFLNYVGYISLAAAGWFFSVFVAEKKIQSEDYFSFIFGRIFAFGSDVFSQGNKLVSFLILLAGLVCILALVTLVFGGIDWLIRRRRRDTSSESQLYVEFDEETGAVHFTPSYPNTLIFSWLHSLPPIFIIGLIFIILSLFGTKPLNVNTLMISLSGQFIGAAIALALTGVMLLYFTTVIEQRNLDRDGNPHSIKSVLLANWELVLTICLFFLMITIILIHRGMSNSTISILGFTVTAMLTAFTLGYGLKYRGLLSAGRDLETKIKNLSAAAEDNERPKSLDLRSIEDDQFRERVKKCLSQFFEMIAIKNELAKELLGERTRKPRLLLNKLKETFEKKRDPNLDDVRELSTIEEKYFPEHKQIIEDLRTEWDRTKNKFDENEKEIKLIKIGKSDFVATTSNEIKALENKIDNYKKVLVKYEKVLSNKIEAIRIWKERCEMDLTDGFNLGLWFREKMPEGLNLNGQGPGDSRN